MSRVLCILLLCLISATAVGADIFILEDSTRALTAARVYELYQQEELLPLQSKNYNPGFTASVFWLVVKAPQHQQENRLVIGDAHINRLDFYRVRQQTPELLQVTGDHYPFRQRLVDNPLYVFPLQNAPEQEVYLVRVDKHNESLQLSAEIVTAADFSEETAQNSLVNGLLWGALALLIIFGLFLYVTVRDRLYLYYALYILTSCLWIIADKGLGFQYFWADYPSFASRARPIFSCLMAVALIQFMQHFIGQTSSSKLYKPLKVIQVFCLAIAAAFLIPFYNSVLHDIAAVLLVFMLVLYAAAMVLILLSIYYKIRQQNRQAWYYLISVLALAVFSLTEMFIHSGGGSTGLYYLSNFGIQTGLVIEASILIFGLAHRFNQYKKDREYLLVQINKEQQQLTDRIMQVQEAERKKIADQLHDEVGSMLSLVSLQLSSALDQEQAPEKATVKLQKAGEVLSSVSQTIRNMSHTLSPLAIEKYGFRKAILDLVQSVNVADQVKVEHVILGFEDTQRYSPTLLNDIYRMVSELMNNILKHAYAANAFLQLIEHHDCVSIQVEDNGRSMDLSSPAATSGVRKGMGLENIHSKVAYYGGIFEVSRRQEGGTSILIEIPVNTNK